MPATKKAKLSNILPPFSSPYYPPELSDRQVAQKYLKDENKPINILTPIVNQKAPKSLKGNGIVHLFNNDLRISNNRGLHEAATIAASANLPVVGLYVHCVEELYSHSVGKFQLQFKHDSLQLLHTELQKKQIPLFVVTIDHKKDFFNTIKQFLIDHKYNCLTTNLNYEVDELRDAIKLQNLQDSGIEFRPFHDTCVVAPGQLASGKGTQYSVFTPWYKSWAKLVNSEKIEDYPAPQNEKHPDTPSKDENKLGVRMFHIPEDLTLSDSQQKSYHQLYKPGEAQALEVLSEYLREDIKAYDRDRNEMSLDSSSHLSPYLAIGAISARTILLKVLSTKLLSQVDKGDAGAVQWVRQVAWRDFYKHVVANWPHICMFRPFHLEYSLVEWEYNQDHYDAWCQGRTGYPIVDACMRQLNQTGYLSNRGRMIVASFLSKHLMIDWRYGERYFLSVLVDGDFASNNGGWGFSSSTGVDPQPYFRIFNPYLQSERFDKEGEYIRKWVPELGKLGKDIHQPGLETAGEYPRPVVEHKWARERALERYREAR